MTLTQLVNEVLFIINRRKPVLETKRVNIIDVEGHTVEDIKLLEAADEQIS